LKVQDLDIPGLILITPDVYRDGRGFFLETFREDMYKEILGMEFVQDNMSYSIHGTIRGLHFQVEPHRQSKLVRCAWGRILDVVIDIRSGSPTFGKLATVELSGEDQKQLYVPVGFAHGFSVLSTEAIVEYKCGAYYNRAAEKGIRYNDPLLGIDWKIKTGEETVSAKDAGLPTFAEIFKGKNT
jgi:dTDP-4-dehydrorhamnose 3,5-epimerase